MAISPFCARTCWQINRLRLQLVGVFLISPESVLETIADITSSDPKRAYPDELKKYVESVIPHVPIYHKDGVILNPYSPDELNTLPLEKRYDAEYAALNQYFNAFLLFIWQVCSSSEAFLKEKLAFILSKHPKLMKKKRQELTIQIDTILDAGALNEVISILIEQTVSSVISGKQWNEKLKRFCKFLDLSVPAPKAFCELNEMYRLRNELSHEREPAELDLSFLEPSLVINRKSDTKVYYRGMNALVQFADSLKDELYNLDQAAKL